MYVHSSPKALVPHFEVGHRKQIIGDVNRFKTKSEAKKAVGNLRAEINASEQRVATMTVEEAWGHFQVHELYVSVAQASSASC
jgi:hypothetical protein